MVCLRKVAILGLLLVAATTQAEQFGDFHYGVVGSNIQIYAYTGLGGDVVIPEEIDGMPVTTIDRDAFANITGLTSVAIPTNVTAIYDSAFSGCTGLTTVSLSANLTTLYNGVFGRCTGLTNITVSLDNPVLSSSNGILYDKAGTTLLEFPGGIGGSVAITEGVTRIAADAFLGNTALGDVNFPDTLAAIGSWAFSGCNGLTKVTIPASVSNLAAGVFGYCTNLTAIGVSISNVCYCSSDGILFNKSQTMLIQYPGGRAGSYDVPAGITNVSSCAFSGCTGLTAVTIPDNGAVIDTSAFSGCTGLTTMSVPGSVKTIESGTFYGCTGLTNIVLNEGVTNIGSGAFSECSALENIHIPDSVTRLAWGAFQNCSALTNIVLGAGLATIESRVFYECNNLQNLYIPKSVTNLWNAAFDYCHGLTNITVAIDNPTYRSVDGVVFDKSGGSLLHFPGGRTGRYIVPGGVQSIGDYAFDQCLGIASVELPAACVYLGRYAFSHCANLTGICFHGGPPGLGIQTFLFASNAIMYYRADHAAEWGATFAVRPTAIWPEFSTAEIQPDGFVFEVVASDGQEVVTETCPDLATGDWAPVSTNIVSGGSLAITIPDWAAVPSCFYRVTVR
jgi:hypothetical protein